MKSFLKAKTGRRRNTLKTMQDPVNDVELVPEESRTPETLEENAPRTNMSVVHQRPPLSPRQHHTMAIRQENTPQPRRPHNTLVDRVSTDMVRISNNSNVQPYYQSQRRVEPEPIPKALYDGRDVRELTAN